jgi:hypothetical protein
VERPDSRGFAAAGRTAAGIALAWRAIMMRERLAVVVAAACASACVDEPAAMPPAKPTEASALAVTLASTSGVTGTITTLATYGGGTAHPGTNAIDIGAPGGSAVVHQLDYLPPEIAGGWIWVEDVHEAGRCSQWWPGSPYYNGSKIYVHVYFHDAGGGFLGSHRAAFQHVDPNWEYVNTWWTWNNAGAWLPAWPGGAHVTYGNGPGGGLHLGAVHAVWSSIYNGPGGGLCTTGSHLHQESDGWRAGQRWVGEYVTSGYSDLHYFQPVDWWSAGAPPFPPGQPPPPPSGCGELTYHGYCDGSILVWCDNDAVQSYDCASAGLGCGWQDDAVGHNCL